MSKEKEIKPITVAIACPLCNEPQKNKRALKGHLMTEKHYRQVMQGVEIIAREVNPKTAPRGFFKAS